MPEFSIVIPVYNGAHHIAACLDSILEQGVREIEVICIDDCGSDASSEILAFYSHRDSRVKVLVQPENRGTARARRRGVLESTGDYLLFCDQDDELVAGSLAFLHNQISQNPSDVFYLDTELVNDGDITEEEYEGVRGWLKPPDASFAGKSVLDACFLDRTVDHSVWNKAYRGTMAREALRQTQDVSIPLGEDNYESFVLLYSAETMSCFPEKALYRYHFGRGFTGHTTQSLESFERVVGLSVADSLIHDFLVSRQALFKYRDTYSACRTHMIEYMLDRWQSSIADSDKKTALSLILVQWDFGSVYEVLVKRSRRQAITLFLLSVFGRKQQNR